MRDTTFSAKSFGNFKKIDSLTFEFMTIRFYNQTEIDVESIKFFLTTNSKDNGFLITEIVSWMVNRGIDFSVEYKYCKKNSLIDNIKAFIFVLSIRLQIKKLEGNI